MMVAASKHTLDKVGRQSDFLKSVHNSYTSMYKVCTTCMYVHVCKHVHVHVSVSTCYEAQTCTTTRIFGWQANSKCQDYYSEALVLELSLKMTFTDLEELGQVRQSPDLDVVDVFGAELLKNW